MAMLKLATIDDVDEAMASIEVGRRLLEAFCSHFGIALPADSKAFIDAINETTFLENEDDELLEFSVDAFSAKNPSELERKFPKLSPLTVDCVALAIDVSPLFSDELKSLLANEIAQAKETSWRDFKNQFTGRHYAEGILERARQYQPNTGSREWVNVPAIRAVSLYLFLHTRRHSNPISRITDKRIHGRISAFLSDFLKVKSGFDAGLKEKFIKDRIHSPLPPRMRSSLKFLSPMLQSLADAKSP